jgi:hypothetical protein
MESVVSLAVTLLTLIVVIKFITVVFGSDSRSGGSSRAGVPNQQSGELDDDHDEMPGMPGRWNSPLERDRYYRARGHDMNWME